MRNILTSSQELDNFKIATIEASVSDTDHASVTVPTIARGYRKGDTVTLLSDGSILIKTASGDILDDITISLDTGASIYAVGFNAVSSMVAYTEYPLTEDINYINYGISYTPPAPTTKRLLLYVTTDGAKSNDGKREDYNTGETISYVDMPVDYSGIFLISAGSNDFEFRPADGSRAPDSSLEFRALSSPRVGIVFKGIKYIPYGGTAFTVDLTQTYQGIPTGETGGLLQDGDEMVMIFETQTGPSIFTYMPAPTSTNYTSQINSWYGSSVTVQSGNVAAVLEADDGYLYTATSYADWNQYKFYIEVMKLDTSMNIVEHSPVSTTQNGINAPMMTFGSYSRQENYSQWTNNVDSSITNAQTLGEWIYNNLQ